MLFYYCILVILCFMQRNEIIEMTLVHIDYVLVSNRWSYLNEIAVWYEYVVLEKLLYPYFYWKSKKSLYATISIPESIFLLGWVRGLIRPHECGRLYNISLPRSSSFPFLCYVLTILSVFGLLALMTLKYKSVEWSLRLVTFPSNLPRHSIEWRWKGGNLLIWPFAPRVFLIL